MGYREAKRNQGVVVSCPKANVRRLHHAMRRFGSREIITKTFDRTPFLAARLARRLHHIDGISLLARQP